MEKKLNRESANISVILSFYNEEAVLPELLRRLRMVFSSLIDNRTISSYELIFINDCSTDASEKFLLSELKGGDIVIITMSRNFGVTECVLAGMVHAKGDAVIYMDCDLQDPPELIIEFAKKWEE